MQVIVASVCLSAIHLLKKGWFLYNLKVHKYFVLRDVIFFKDVFPYLDHEIANVSPPSLAVDYAPCLDWFKYPEPGAPLVGA